MNHAAFDLKKHKPTVGPTGSPVISMSVERDTAEERHRRRFAPRPPERQVAVYDSPEDDEPSGHRTLSDEEFDEAYRAYETASEEYERNPPKLTVGLIDEGDRVVARIECEDGCKASGTWDGGEWRWTKWSVS